MDPHLHLLSVMDRLIARAAACARETPIGWYSGLCEESMVGTSVPKTFTNTSKEVGPVLETIVVSTVNDGGTAKLIVSLEQESTDVTDVKVGMLTN